MRPNLGQLSSHSDSKRSTTISTTRLPSQNNNRRRRMPENDGNCRNDASHRECGVTWQLNRRQCPISELRTVPITNPDSLLVLVGEDDESHSRDDAIMRQGLTKRCEMRQNNEGPVSDPFLLLIVRFTDFMMQFTTCQRLWWGWPLSSGLHINLVNLKRVVIFYATGCMALTTEFILCQRLWMMRI